ncbi:MAG: PHP domain-containing protein, partial [Chloroflexi bacterium]|nr:PHP domain-containing protein [Chloroflexota bacterium]
PFDRFRHGLGDEGLLRVLPQVDVMETFNARAMLPSDNDRARRFAEEHSLPRIAVSDAHSAWEVGRSYVELPPFKGPEGFLDSVRRAKTVERLSSPLIHLVSRWSVLRRRVLGWKPVRV